jgi:hypothetical protein
MMTIDERGEVAGLGTPELLALRNSLRERISLLFAEKSRLNGLIRAAEDGESLPGADDARTLRHRRRIVNAEITERSATLDDVKLRLFTLQAPPKAKIPVDPQRQTTTEERAARLAQIEADGPDALLLRAARVLHHALDAYGVDRISEDDRRTLREISFYLRQKFGKAAWEGRA